MIELESETPFVNWTSDAFNSKGSHQAVERAVWHHSPIFSYTITDSCVAFDAPPEWGEGASPVRLQRTPGWHYEYHSQSAWFKSVRAETRTHVIMTGSWIVRTGATGIFIAVLPVQQRQIAIEGTARTLSVGNYA